MYRDHYVLNSARTGGSWSTTKIFTGWKTRTRIVAPGDVTGDYLPDPLSVDSGGTLWIYPGKGNGTFGPAVKVGTGWNRYNQVRGHGDFTGDGRADLLARRSRGKSGSAAFSARVKVRSAWTGYNAFDAVGDVGTRKATSEIFATRVSVGTGFQAYDQFG